MKDTLINIFITKSFARWAKKEKISNSMLAHTTRTLSQGLIDADLGNGLMKQRVARPGQGKRGSYRTLLAFRHNERVIFLFGFSKNDRTNIDGDEQQLYKKLSHFYLLASNQQLKTMCINKQLIEVKYEAT